MCLDSNVLKAHQETKSLNRAGFLATRPLDVLTSGRLGCTLAEEAPSIIALEGFATYCGAFGSASGDSALRSYACDSSSRSSSGSSGISTLLGLVTKRRCLGFLRITLDGVWMTYDLGV